MPLPVFPEPLKQAWLAFEAFLKADGYVQADEKLAMIMVAGSEDDEVLRAQIATLTTERDAALARVTELEALVENGAPTAAYASAARQTIQAIDEVPRPPSEAPALTKKKR